MIYDKEIIFILRFARRIYREEIGNFVFIEKKKVKI